MYVCQERASQRLRIRNCLRHFLESDNFKLTPESQHETPPVKELFFSLFPREDA